MYLSESSPIGTQTNLDTLMQFEQSENYDLSFLANVSELRYVDAVRTTVRTTVLRKLNEVNSDSSTEFRDIDAV